MADRNSSLVLMERATPEEVASGKRLLAIKGMKDQREHVYASSSQRLIDDVKRQTGEDITGIPHTANPDNMNHIVNKHMRGGRSFEDNAKRHPNNVPLEDKDVLLFPYIYSHYDTVKAQKVKEGLKLTYTWTSPEKKIYIIEKGFLHSIKNSPRLSIKTSWTLGTAAEVTSVSVSPVRVPYKSNIAFDPDSVKPDVQTQRIVPKHVQIVPVKSRNGNIRKESLDFLKEHAGESFTTLTGESVRLPLSNKKNRHIWFTSQGSRRTRESLIRNYNYILNVKDLIENSKYYNKEKNKKITKKPAVRNYWYFTVDAEYKGKIRKLWLVCEEINGGVVRTEDFTFVNDEATPPSEIKSRTGLPILQVVDLYEIQEAEIKSDVNSVKFDVQTQRITPDQVQKARPRDAEQIEREARKALIRAIGDENRLMDIASGSRTFEEFLEEVTQWILGIYRGMETHGVTLTDDIVKAYDDLLTRKDSGVAMAESGSVLAQTVIVEKHEGDIKKKALMFLNENAGKKFRTLTGETIQLPTTHRQKRHVWFTSKKNASEAEMVRNYNYILAIQDLAENSVFAGKAKNEKFDKKPGISNYWYFKVNVEYGGKRKKLRLVCEQINGNVARTSDFNLVNRVTTLPSTLTYNPSGQTLQVVDLYEIQETKTISGTSSGNSVKPDIQTQRITPEQVQKARTRDAEQIEREARKAVIRSIGGDKRLMDIASGSRTFEEFLEEVTQWILGIYRGMETHGVTLTDDISKAYDDLLTKKDSVVAKAEQGILKQASKKSLKYNDSIFGPPTREALERAKKVGIDIDAWNGKPVADFVRAYGDVIKKDIFAGEFKVIDGLRIVTGIGKTDMPFYKELGQMKILQALGLEGVLLPRYAGTYLHSLYGVNLGHGSMADGIVLLDGGQFVELKRTTKVGEALNDAIEQVHEIIFISSMKRLSTRNVTKLLPKILETNSQESPVIILSEQDCKVYANFEQKNSGDRDEHGSTFVHGSKSTLAEWKEIPTATIKDIIKKYFVNNPDDQRPIPYEDYQNAEIVSGPDKPDVQTQRITPDQV